MKAVKFNYSGLICPVFTAFANDRYRILKKFHKKTKIKFIELIHGLFLVHEQFDIM